MNHTSQMTPLSNQANRLRDLRSLLGLTQTDLARQLNTQQSLISDYEKARRKIPQALLSQACFRFHISPQFFELPANIYLDGDLNYRAKKTNASTKRAADTTFFEYERALRAVMPPQKRHLPTPARTSKELSIDEIEYIASTTRNYLGIPTTGYVHNVTRAIEHAGIPIAVLTNAHFDFSEIDGISSPELDGVPIITITETVAGDRARFTRAHELGHLVLHRKTRPGDLEVCEREAHLFASAFLFPRTDADIHLSQSLTLEGYARIKAHYAVSIQALILRAYTLGIITEQRKRSLFIQLSSRGWRTHEPVTVPVENITTPQPMIPGITTDPTTPTTPTHQNPSGTVIQLHPRA